MPALCDVNFLASLCYQHHSHHTFAIKWLEQHDVERAFAISRISQMGLLRMLGTRSIMNENTLTAHDTWRVYDALIDDDRFVFIPEPLNLDKTLRRLTSRHSPITGLWTDAYLAAFAITAGLQFVTFDKGFRQFPDLDLVLLGDIEN
jgi:toxin-antitoxin system PIN domain toxin